MDRYVVTCTKIVGRCIDARRYFIEVYLLQDVNYTLKKIVGRCMLDALFY